jgi:DNA replication and repair protein RecF
MIVARIKLGNFRNHSYSSLEFGDGINVLLGDNGEGKTNVLEAISYLSLTKSFYASADETVVQLGQDGFEVDGGVVTAGGVEHRVRVAYSRARGEKAYEINGTKPERLSDVIGRFPIVILSPENAAITTGGPGDRRKFVDLVLSQISPAYFETLLEYRRVVRQRNRMLFDARLRGTDPGVATEPWDESLASLAGTIVFRRREFVAEFREYITRAYAILVEGEREEPGIAYISSCLPPESNASSEEIRTNIRQALAGRRSEELRRGTTLVGPHRDDLALTLAKMPVQQYASQGQHKTLLVAMKIAEFHFVRERRGEHPILLLDDVFSELDAHRAGHILRLSEQLGQTIITTTDERIFAGTVSWNGTHRRFYVEHGTCRPG